MAQVGTRRRGKRHERAAIAMSILAAAVVHAAVVEGADATGMLAGWGGMGGTEKAKPGQRIATPPLRPSCDGDAVLAAAARMATCATPFATDREACLRESAQLLESDRLACHRFDLPTVGFTLAPIDVKELEQIDPEPLLEMLDEQRQKEFEQKQQEQQVALAQEAERRKTVIEAGTQVIEIPKPTVEIAPDKTRFVSEYDNKVERETYARGSRFEEIAAKSKAEQLEVKESPREATAKPREPDMPGTNPDAPRAPGLLRMRAPGANDPAQQPQEAHVKGLLGGIGLPIGDGMRGRRGDGLITTESRTASEQPRGDNGAGGGTPRVPDLRPSDDVLERAAGGGSVDAFDEVEEGEETALNSKQWVYAAFMNRVKRGVYGYKTRITRVRVTLSSAGALTSIVVLDSSGIDFLDEEAVSAFRAAQPFPNPPDAMPDASGNISFNFAFRVTVGGGQKATWKIFRTL
jgi:TonB family protein